MSTEHRYHRALQQEILNKTLEVLKASDHVLGITNTGSFVTTTNDAFSDIDVDCYLADEEKRGRTELMDKVSEIAPLLARLWVYDKHALFLFENGVRLDLNFYKPSEIKNESIDTCKILYDPTNALKSGITGMLTDKAGTYPHPPWTPDDFEYLDWFFWMFRQVYCWTKRGDQSTEKSFNKLTNAVNSLAQIRDHLFEVRLWLHGSWDYMSQVDPEFAERMRQTYPHCEVQEILHCTRLLLAEFEQLCLPYCGKRNIAYPVQKLEIIKRMLDMFDQVL